jgi:hypothetical protein
MVSCDGGGSVLRMTDGTRWSVDNNIFDAGYADDIYMGDLVLAGGNSIFGSHCTGILPCGNSTNILSGGNNVELLAECGDLGGTGGHSADASTSGGSTSDEQPARC